MKKILFSLFLILILTSCSKQKKETALENCADANYKKSGISTQLKNQAKILIDKDENYIKLQEEGLQLKEQITKLKKKLDLMANNYLLENPKPTVKKLEEVIDITRDDLTLEEIKKVKIKIKDDHWKAINIWKKKSNINLYTTSNTIKYLEKLNVERFLEVMKLEINYQNKIFEKISLKDKSKYKSYLKKYTKCENDYNKTPNAFLLEWRNN